MEEKILLQHLDSFKKVQPDSQWKKSSRDILVSQIFGQTKISRLQKIKTFNDVLSGYFKEKILQPAWTVVMVLIIILGGGVLSLEAARDTKPGDSLYIAKIVSEKTQIALTFNEKEKAKLNIKFAGNRVKEITQVLSGLETDKARAEETIKKLSSDFKKEISAAKSVLGKIQPEEKKENGEIALEDDKVFSANLDKSEQGMELSLPVGEEKKDNGQATTTAGDQLSSGKEAAEPQEVLEQAEKLFEKEDYKGTVNKLEELNVIINDEAEGAVKGEEDKTTTTTSKAEGGSVLGESEVSSSTSF